MTWPYLGGLARGGWDFDFADDGGDDDDSPPPQCENEATRLCGYCDGQGTVGCSACHGTNEAAP